MPIATSPIDGLSETDPEYLSLVTMVEMYWVMRRGYKVPKPRCIELLGGLLDARELRIDHDEIVRLALAAAHGGQDFADAVIAELGQAAGCEHTEAFDRKAARHGAMQLLDGQCAGG